MTKGILGKKVGMTQFFTENGELVPVTVIEATPNVVLQVKTMENDGYEAVQLGFQDLREVLSNKPAKGHVAKANATPKRFIREFREVELGEYQVGQEITVETFAAGDIVDVTGTSKGKGLPGQTGGERVTIQNLEVVAVDVENNVILIKGNVPGAKKSLVEIKQAIKTVK